MAAGGTKDDVVHVSYGYGLFTGGPGLNGGSHKVGSLTLPMSSGNTDRQIQFMTDLGSTILCCTPSYAAYLAETICERGLQDQIKLCLLYTSRKLAAMISAARRLRALVG